MDLSTNNIIFRLVKVSDIALVGNYFFFGGIIMSLLINNILPKYDDENVDKVPTAILWRDIFLNVSLIMIIAYILRNIIQLIPSPFEGIAGFEHSRLKELSGGVVLAFSIFSLQPNLKARLLNFVKRFQ